MPPHIFEVCLKVNTKVYLNVLKSVVISWCNQVVGGRPWVWQQDSALAHKSKETQSWLQKECYDFVPFSHWPPSSPDLNPLEFFVGSYVEKITNMTSHKTKASLIAAIRRVLAELPPALVILNLDKKISVVFQTQYFELNQRSVIQLLAAEKEKSCEVSESALALNKTQTASSRIMNVVRQIHFLRRELISQTLLLAACLIDWF